MRFELNQGQSDLYFADTTKYQELLAVSGEQGGKTSVGCLWLRRIYDQTKEKHKYNFLVTAPTYKILSQSTLPTFKEIFTNATGRYRGGDDAFQLLRNGRPWGQVFFRSGTNPDSVIGIPNCRAALMDELGKCTRAFYYSVKGRLGRLGGTLYGATTPYAMNFVYKDMIKDAESGERDNILYRRWASTDNPSYPMKEAERLKAILPPKLYRMRVLGIHERMEGLVFEDFGAGTWCDAFDTQGLDCYGGIDWGFEHPFSIVIRVVPGDGSSYTCYVFRRSGLSVSQQLELIRQQTKFFNVKTWYCGHDRPDMIRELQSEGIAAIKFFEGRNEYREINAGNQKHAELIRSGKYRVFRGIPQAEDLEEEYETYHWDTKSDQEVTKLEKPIQLGEDLLSAERFVSVGIFHLLTIDATEAKLPKDYDMRHDEFNPSDDSVKIYDWTDV